MTSSQNHLRKEYQDSVHDGGPIVGEMEIVVYVVLLIAWAAVPAFYKEIAGIKASGQNVAVGIIRTVFMSMPALLIGMGLIFGALRLPELLEARGVSVRRAQVCLGLFVVMSALLATSVFLPFLARTARSGFPRLLYANLKCVFAISSLLLALYVLFVTHESVRHLLFKTVSRRIGRNILIVIGWIILWGLVTWLYSRAAVVWQPPSRRASKLMNMHLINVGVLLAFGSRIAQYTWAGRGALIR